MVVEYKTPSGYLPAFWVYSNLVPLGARVGAAVLFRPVFGPNCRRMR
jgi:hypothetical protein